MLGVLFEGTLEITDPQQFLNRSIAAGIGSGKAFGFGLLSVAPYHRSQG
jgi:CRISPR system Cascade subunit CasE